jgi:signal transduction histidine kinase/CheY-like chemotaxis protein
MSSAEPLSRPLPPSVAVRAQELYEQQQCATNQKVDRWFAALLGFQYAACVFSAIWLSPRAWTVPHDSQLNLFAGIFLGGAVTLLPIAFALVLPGRVMTRHIIAVGQMLMSGLLVHLMGGRLETHFHVFGSLAFLAFYRDWKVLLTASLVVTLDLLFRGIYWPQSVFGFAHPAPWRWLEHVGWILFADVFLISLIQQTRTILWSLVQRRAELERARDAAEQASHAKDEFIAVLSHELRTPLTPALMTLSSLAEDDRVESAVRAELALVRRNVELEARLIDDLLDLTRIARGKLQLTQGNLDLHTVIDRIVDTCGVEFQEKNLTVQREYHARRSWVHGDEVRLQQVFWNLLKNAIKFTPSGGKIEIHSSDVAERIKIDVVDSGRGIEAEVLPRLFHRFEQGGAEVTRQFGGLGLGLSICRAIVELHHGAIRAESRGAGWGATFTVILPARVSVDPPATRVQTQWLRLSGLLPRRVLLVDDHQDTRETLARLLTRAGYEVAAAGCTKAALQAAEERKFDLLLSDIGLPDGSGCDLMREMKRRYDLCGVAFSGFGMEDDVRRSLDAGFAAHLTKPVDFKRLKEAMGKALSEKGEAAAVV